MEGKNRDRQTDMRNNVRLGQLKAEKQGNREWEGRGKQGEREREREEGGRSEGGVG